MTRCCGNTSRLDYYVDLLTKTTVANAIGGRVETWSLLKSIFAEMLPSKTNPKSEAMRIEGQTNYNFTVRYDADILGLEISNCRLRYGARYFFVKSIININEGYEFLGISAVEDKKAVVNVV